MSRIRTTAAATLLTLGMTVPFAGTALAQDLNCDDFSTQAEAQEVFNQNTADPNGLDRNDDNIACESLPGGPGGTAGAADDTEGDDSNNNDEATNDGSDDNNDDDEFSGEMPSGGVEAGAGGTAGGDDSNLVPVTLLGAGLLGGVALAMRRPTKG